MLETVKAKLQEPVKPFGVLFIEYIMEVQDSNIEAELKPLMRVNNVNTLGLMIDQEVKDLR